MNKIKINILLIALFTFFSSCSDLLDLKPEDKLIPTSYFSNKAELQLWTNQFYSQLDEADDLAGQNADDNVDNALGSVMMGQRDPADESGWNWSMLRRINYYLQNSAKCKDIVSKNQYDGVAYFFRAYFYALKVRRYGDVPLYNQVLNSTDDDLLFKPRDNREVVMDSVMADLNKAIQLLPTVKSNYTVTKWTALALKSRVALYEGAFRKYHNLGNHEKFLNEAVQASEEFINANTYKLYTTGTDPYRNLFNSLDVVSDEIILARNYNAVPNITHSIPFNIINAKQGFTKRFMNHYLMSDGSRFTSQAGWETLSFVKEVTNRDPRLKQTVLTPGYIQKGGTTVTVNKLNAVTGYQPIKFVAESAYDGASKAVTDWPLFRAAEVYLNFAEAKAELNTISQTDLDKSIGKIRTRAGLPALNLVTANANPDDLLASYYPNVNAGINKGVILEIRRERTVELALEGFRQWDLLRWKEGSQLSKPFLGIYFPGPGKYDMDNNGVDDLALWTGTPVTIPGGTSKEIGVSIILSNGNSGYVVAYPTLNVMWNEQRDYLWPIPTVQRVLTRGLLTQNSGWTDSSGF